MAANGSRGGFCGRARADAGRDEDKIVLPHFTETMNRDERRSDDRAVPREAEARRGANDANAPPRDGILYVKR